MKKNTLLVAFIFISAISFAQVNEQACFGSQTINVLNHLNTNPSAPKLVLDSLNYDGDEFISAGLKNATFAVFAFFPAATLASHVAANHAILSEKLFINGVADVATIELRFYTDTLESALIYSQAFTAVDGWNDVVLNTPLIIPSTGNLFIGYQITTLNGYPAGCDAGPANPSANWVHYGNWAHLNALSPSLIGNWNIRAMCGPSSTPQAVSEISQELVSVFPNPANNKLFIAANQLKSVEIFNLTGAKVASFGNHNSIDISNLTQGTYLVRVITEGKVTSVTKKTS